MLNNGDEMHHKVMGIDVVQWKQIVEGWTLEINYKAQGTGDKW
jgi:hypothetical protein